MNIHECPHCQGLIGVATQKKTRSKVFFVALPYKCEQCGVEFIPGKARNRAMRFCSARCRIQSNNDRRLAKERRQLRRGSGGPLLRSSRLYGGANFEGPILKGPI